MTTASTPTPAQIIKQAYTVSAHAHVAALGLTVGDRVYIHNFLNVHQGKVCDRNRAPLVPGCTITTNTTNPGGVYGEQVEFRGINADGDLMVRKSGRDYPQPYNFVTVVEEGNEVQRANLRLNDSYTGTVLGDGSSIAVGCQRFKTDKLEALLALAKKTAGEIAAKKATRAAAPTLTASPTATYVVTPPKAAKKVATVAKKAPAKKATKNVARARSR